MDHLGFNEEEDADVYLDALRGKRVIRFAVISIVILFSLILTYILL